MITLDGRRVFELLLAGWQLYHQRDSRHTGYVMCVVAMQVLWTEYMYLQRRLVPANAAATFDVPMAPWLGAVRNG